MSHLPLKPFNGSIDGLICSNRVACWSPFLQIIELPPLPPPFRLMNIFSMPHRHRNLSWIRWPLVWNVNDDLFRLPVPQSVHLIAISIPTSPRELNIIFQRVHGLRWSAPDTGYTWKNSVWHQHHRNSTLYKSSNDGPPYLCERKRARHNLEIMWKKIIGEESKHWVCVLLDFSSNIWRSTTW